MAFDFNNRTQRWNRIIELGLDSETIAKEFIEVHAAVISKQRGKGIF